MILIRCLPPETAHNLALWGLRTGAWRIAAVLDALITLAWAAPAAWMLRRLEKRVV